MADQPRDGDGRYASTAQDEPRSRFGVGDVEKSRSPFAGGPVLSPALDNDRSRFAAGEVYRPDAVTCRTRVTGKVVQIPEVNRPGARNR